jgi:hypothetical protein
VCWGVLCAGTCRALSSVVCCGVTLRPLPFVVLGSAARRYARGLLCARGSSLPRSVLCWAVPSIFGTGLRSGAVSAWEWVALGVGWLSSRAVWRPARVDASVTAVALHRPRKVIAVVGVLGEPGVGGRDRFLGAHDPGRADLGRCKTVQRRKLGPDGLIDKEGRRVHSQRREELVPKDVSQRLLPEMPRVRDLDGATQNSGPEPVAGHTWVAYCLHLDQHQCHRALRPDPSRACDLAEQPP